VIAATGDKVVMRPSLDEALAALFGGQETPQINGVSPPSANTDQVRNQLAAMQKAIDSLKLLLNSGAAPKR
jgi:uncharacterized membrane protein (UPF0182 family)